MSLKLRDGYGDLTDGVVAIIIISIGSIIVIGGLYLYEWHESVTCVSGETTRAIGMSAFNRVMDEYDVISYDAYPDYIIITYVETCGGV